MTIIIGIIAVIVGACVWACCAMVGQTDDCDADLREQWRKEKENDRR